jgi:hypothetical protein
MTGRLLRCFPSRDARFGERRNRHGAPVSAPCLPAVVVQPRMACAHPDRQQGRVGRLGPAALGAAARIGVGMGGVEKLNEDDVEGGALGLSFWQIAYALDDDCPVLELTTPAARIGGRVIGGFE